LTRADLTGADLTGNRTDDIKWSKISLVETVEIPPESEMIIKGRAVGPISYDSVGIVKSTEHFVE
jgi:hypothetical protein